MQNQNSISLPYKVLSSIDTSVKEFPPGPYFKVLDIGQKPYNSGRGKWTPNRWRNVREKLVPCENGLHFVTIDQALDWLGPEIWAFEPKPGTDVMHAGDKLVCRSGRVTTQYTQWNERTARLFAVECAARVLPLFEKMFPHNSHPREAVAFAYSFAKGYATAEELEVARDNVMQAVKDAADAAVWQNWWKDDANLYHQSFEEISWRASRDAADAARAARECTNTEYCAAEAAGLAATHARYTYWAVGDQRDKNTEREWQVNRLAEILGIVEPSKVF